MSSLLVSACLLGRPCRYDGGSRPAPAVAQRVAAHRARGGQVVAVCPEELGGLGTPRPAAELSGGDGAQVLAGRATVRRKQDGADLGPAFLRGARIAAELGAGATHALLKARSPSCGCGRTWVDGALRPGDGVFAALLRARGLALSSDEDLSSAPAEAP